MAAHPVVIVDDELLAKLPEGFRDDPRYRRGARLELVPLAEASADNRKTAVDAFIAARGMFANSGWDGNAALEAERLQELADEKR